jgi:hypothetical protein
MDNDASMVEAPVPHGDTSDHNDTVHSTGDRADLKAEVLHFDERDSCLTYAFYGLEDMV